MSFSLCQIAITQNPPSCPGGLNVFGHWLSRRTAALAGRPNCAPVSGACEWLGSNGIAAWRDPCHRSAADAQGGKLAMRPRNAQARRIARGPAAKPPRDLIAHVVDGAIRIADQRAANPDDRGDKARALGN